MENIHTLELEEVKEGSFIYQIKNCLPSRLCHELIERFNNDHRLEDGVTLSGYNPDIKKTKDLIISDHPDWAAIDAEIFGITGEILETISKINPFLVHKNISDTGYKLGMYEPGDGFKLHSDQFEHRRAVIMWYLNGVDEGGETEFPSQGVKIRPEEGKMILFPTSWTHPHEGKPPVSGKKYILNTWLI